MFIIWKSCNIDNPFLTSDVCLFNINIGWLDHPIPRTSPRWCLFQQERQLREKLEAEKYQELQPLGYGKNHPGWEKSPNRCRITKGYPNFRHHSTHFGVLRPFWTSPRCFWFEALILPLPVGSQVKISGPMSTIDSTIAVFSNPQFGSWPKAWDGLRN